MFRFGVRRLSGIAIALGVIGGVVLGGSPAHGGEEEDQKALREELGKLVDTAAKSLAEELSKLVRSEEAHKRFIDSVAKLVDERAGKRVAELEKRLAEKERRIAELEQKVAELNALAAAAKASKAKPEKSGEAKEGGEKPEEKKPTNAFLGVSHIDHDGGARVTRVHEASPAYAAGLREGDVIAAVNDERVTSEALSPTLTTHEPGTEVKLTVVRGDRRLEVPVKLVDREKFFARREEEARKASEGPEPLELGIEVVEPGLVVDTVESGFTGDAIGLAKGDRILAVNGKEVKNIDQIVDAVKAIKAGEEFSLLTQRGDRKIRVVAVGSSGKGGAKLLSRMPVSEEKEEGDEAASARPKERPGKPGYMGVTTYEDAVEKIVVVTSLFPGGAGETAGLKPGDVLLKVAGRRITSHADLIEVMETLRAGDDIQLAIERQGEEKEISLELGERLTD